MQQVVLDSISMVSLKVLIPLQMLITALILILIGWLAAKLLQYLVVLVLKAVKFDEVLQSIKFDRILTKGELKKTASELLGEMAYWLVLIISVLGVAGAFGIGFAVNTLDGMIKYTTVVFSAAIVLGLAAFLATLLSELVRFIMLNLDLPYAKTIGRIVSYAVLTFGFMIALGQFGFDLNWITVNISVVVGAVGLGAAIAFGLGCKDLASDFLYNLFKGR
ncbi:MAG: hypothetical protein NT099_07240 [Candidatus Saganbacteria bacterium]|nr:hypothetical protein [Candidatus Saganbacteria bacterium]